MPTQHNNESEAEFFNRVGWKVGDIIRGKQEFGEFWSVSMLKILYIGDRKVFMSEMSRKSNAYGLEVFDPPAESASWAFHYRDWEKVEGEIK